MAGEVPAADQSYMDDIGQQAVLLEAYGHEDPHLFRRFGHKCLELVKPAIAIGLAMVGSFTTERYAAEAADSPENVLTEPPLQPNEVRTVALPENSIVIGNLTSIGAGQSAGWSEIFAGQYQGTSTTNIKGFGSVSANTFFIDTGASGDVSFMAGVAAQHEVIDTSIVMPRTNDIELLPSPVRVKDTRQEQRYNAGEIITVPLGAENAGRGAIINLTVDRSMGPSWYAAFPCNEGYQGTSTVNPNGIGATPATDIVKVDSQGNICIIGSHSTAESGGLIIDLKGYTDWQIQAPQRLLDTRETGQRLTAGNERIFQTNVPNGLFIGRLTVDRVHNPGWFAAYPTSGGWPGNSLVNPDGRSATSGLLVVMTDEQGRFSILGSVDGDIIIDQSGLLPLADLGIDPATIGGPERVYDSREEQPIVIPEQYSCDKAAWLERYLINGQQTHKFAVYDAETGQVTRFDAQSSPVMPYDFEIDPAKCNDETLVFSAYNSATGRNSIRQRDLSSGVEFWVPTMMGNAENALEPDPIADNRKLYTNWAYNQRSLLDTSNESYASNVAEFSVSDTNAVLANIQTYELPSHLGPPGDYVKVEVRRRNPNTNQQEVIEHEFTQDTGQRVRSIQVSADGERVYVLRSTNSGQDYGLFSLEKDPTATSPYTGLPKITYTPVQLPAGITGTQLQSYRLIGPSLIVAIVGTTNPQPMLINLATNQSTSLAASTNGFQDASI